MAVPIKQELVQLSDYVWARTRRRLGGLVDDEYFWEPAAGCWTVRPEGDRWVADGAGAPPPEPPPFTTIAWRLFHLTDCYGGDRNAEWLGVENGEPCAFVTRGAGATPSEALDRLAEAHGRWAAVLEAVADDDLAKPLGPIAGPFAAATRTGFVLHMIDEHIHHGSEIAVLRDLYRAR